MPKYNVGDRVIVYHPVDGEWEGTITYVSDTGTGDGYTSGIEYEVSNAPRDRSKQYPGVEIFLRPGNRWHPLLWEEEILYKIGTAD